jgi:hypothetical protein
MKNTVIVHLAGVSFFSIAFLSPVIEIQGNNALPKSHNGAESAGTALQIIPAFISSVTKNTTTFLTSLENKVITKSDTISYALPIEIPISIQPTNADYLPELPQHQRKTSAKKIPARKTKIDSADIDKTSSVLLYHSTTNYSLSAIDSVEATDIEEPEPPSFYIDEEKELPSIVSASGTPIITTSKEAGIDSYPEELLQQRIKHLKDLALENGFSQKYAFMINLGIRSGKKRFHIVDLEKEEIITSGLVAHGKGKEKFTLRKTYSNISGSSCSSLGLYKVGISYKGSFGKSFRLMGLEKSNSNALSRAIVLHAMGCIPDEEINYPICQSEGCPSVSVSFLEKLDEIISKTKQSILLWVFDPLVDNR